MSTTFQHIPGRVLFVMKCPDCGNIIHYYFEIAQLRETVDAGSEHYYHFQCDCECGTNQRPVRMSVRPGKINGDGVEEERHATQIEILNKANDGYVEMINPEPPIRLVKGFKYHTYHLFRDVMFVPYDNIEQEEIQHKAS